VHDPGVGFITLTRVKVTSDLQLARVLYTVMGDEKQKKETVKALERAIPFLRRQIGSRIRLRRVPDLQFFYDESIEHQDRIEQILLDLKRERDAQDAESAPAEAGAQDAAGSLAEAGADAPTKAEDPDKQ